MQKILIVLGSLVGGGVLLIIVAVVVTVVLMSCSPKELRDRKLDQRSTVDLDGVGTVGLPPTFKMQGIVNSGERRWFGGGTTNLEYHLDKRRITFRFEQGQYNVLGGYKANPVLLDVTLFNDTLSSEDVLTVNSTTMDLFYSPTGNSKLTDVEWLPDVRTGGAVTKSGKISKEVSADAAERWLVIHTDPARRTRVDFFAWTKVYTVAEATKLAADVAGSVVRTPALATHFKEIDTFDERMARRHEAKLAELVKELETCGIRALAPGTVAWGSDCVAHLTENKRFLSVGRYLGSAPLSAAQGDSRFRPGFPMAFKQGDFPADGGSVDGLPNLDIDLYYWDEKSSKWDVSGLQTLGPRERFGSDEDRAKSEILEWLAKGGEPMRASAQLWLFHYMDVMFRADEVKLSPFFERADIYEKGLSEGRIIANVKTTKTPFP
jgi:hypothetical protein